jgi:hypothetical protein
VFTLIYACLSVSMTVIVLANLGQLFKRVCMMCVTWCKRA